MRNTVHYEWKLETVDGYDDIIDIDHTDRLAEIYPPGPSQRVCLVRDVGNEEDGLQDRGHAYIKGGTLEPCTMEGGDHVPQRFHKELEACK